mmetsp:Transcript_12984/g.15510  ORF Transcript_12984/g.15510 Transcript_12984/m.15510 type:complete len:522 (-) Transcript_12984:110-1675(-)
MAGNEDSELNKVLCMKEFIGAFKHWHSLNTCLQHELEDNEGRFQLSIGTEVILHSLSNESMNEKKGIIVDYVPLTDRFRVLVDETEFGIKPKNIQLVKNVEEQSDSVECQQISHDFKKIIDINHFKEMISTPGMLFEGTIKIPGDAGAAVEIPGNAQYYSLEIIGLDDDWGMKDDRLLGKHFAYEDTQYVHIKVHETNEGKIGIQYEDGETVCEGIWVEDEKAIRGVVKQMTNPEDNVFMPSDKETHSFILKPTDIHQAKYRKQVSEAFQDCLEKYNVLRKQTDLLGSLHELRSQIRGVSGDPKPVDWLDLLKGAHIENERLCCRFRRGARLLNSLTFKSKQHRTEVLAQLAKSPSSISLSLVHEQWDDAVGLIRGLGQIFGALASGPIDQQMFFSIIMTSQVRLERNFEKLDTSLKKAQSRLTLDTLSEYEALPPKLAGVDLKECMCSICITPLHEDSPPTDDGSALFLPCTHAFHKDCIVSWLQNNRHCPVCRFELQDTPDVEVSVTNQVEVEVEVEDT